MYKKIILLVGIVGLFFACAKKNAFDTPAAGQFDGLYCNDPVAINYNKGFPGTADNSVCIYPTDVFSGSYHFKDSILNGEFELDTVLDYVLTFHQESRTRLKISGFCVNGDTVRLTADRYYRAGVDSTRLIDSSMREGHLFCRALDTISGNVARQQGDTNKIKVYFVIASDTGINYHTGTAVKK